jgi:outer membrane receptor protein involved in Fe transport
MKIKFCVRAVIATVLSAGLLGPSVLYAQALEEIVVTAQRREQSLQEVPISVEAFTGAEIARQGFRDLDGLSEFSASVNVDQESIIGPTIAIRGFGTTGNSVTVDSSTPIFVDGIHYSRNSMMKTAFMDVSQVEVLKGPQPVYFGQNAIAGAFNITSRKPGDVWAGNIDMEYGNNSTQEINAGIGGPINDQWRIRFAGKYESAGGYMTEIITGDELGAYDNYGARVTLQWLPSDKLTLTTKLEYAQIRKDVEANHLCATSGPLIYGRDNPTVAGTIGNERSVFADPPLGEGFSTPFAYEVDSDCFGSNKGISAGGPYLQPPDYIREENSDFGSIDVREAAQGFSSIDNRGIEGYEDIDNTTLLVNLDYAFDNGWTAQWLTGGILYLRNYVRDNSYSGFFMNFQGREEDYNQMSTELRFTSPTGRPIEFNGSLFWQKGDLDTFSSSLRANVRRGQRYNNLFEDQEWLTASGVVTFNLLEDKASIDLGARYATLKKDTGIVGYAANWVFDVTPCDPDFAGFDKENVTPAGIAACAASGTLPANAYQVSADEVRILVDGPVDLNNLWTTTYDPPGGGSSDKREVSPTWLPSQARAVGLTNPDYPTRYAREGGPWFGNFDKNEFDPQVTVRYRPLDNVSTYFRWAQSSKAGGFDTGQTSLSGSFEDFVFEPEYAETFEIGAKGSYMDGRGRFDTTLFTLEFTNLQVSVATPNVDDPFVNINAGSQRVRGLEFDTVFAVTDQLRLGFGGAILEGEFTDFPNSECTQVEARDADSGPCLSEAEALEAATAVFPNDPDAAEDLAGDLEFTIDRTGQKTPRVPDWKFIGQLDYWMPLFGNYRGSLNIKAYYSDGYLTDFEGFDLTNSYDKHGDMNVLVGFGDMDEVWSVALYARNLFEARPTYHPEFDLEPDGRLTSGLSPNAFTTYGLKLRYNFE